MKYKIPLSLEISIRQLLITLGTEFSSGVVGNEYSWMEFSHKGQNMEDITEGNFVVMSAIC